MTKPTEPLFATALDDGLTVPSSTANRAHSRVLARGDEVAITPQFIDHTRDRNGDTVWPGIVADPDAQRERWGRVRLVPGRLAENVDLAAAITTERELAALSEAQKRLLESRRYGRGRKAE